MRRWLDDDSLELEFLTPAGLWVPALPNWDQNIEYRFKPKTIKVGEHEFPEPMRVAPIACTEYWTVEIRSGGAVVEGTVAKVANYFWYGDAQDVACLRAGICHLTKEAAEQHAKALIALTEVKE